MTPKELTKAKIELYGELVCDPKLNAVDLGVAWLLLYQYLNRKSGLAYPAAETMAEKLSVSLSTVRRAIKRLTSPGGYFTIAKGGGRGRSNRYAPNFETAATVTPFKEETVSTVTPFRDGETVSSGTINGVKSGQKTVSRVTREPLEEPFEETLRAARFATPDGDARGATLKTKKVCSAIVGARLENALYMRRQELESGGSLRHATLSDYEREAANEWLRGHSNPRGDPAHHWNR